jgi:acyl carrier protein
MKTVEETLKWSVARYLEALKQEVDESKLNRDTRFKEDLSMDSLDMIELAMYLEETLGIDLEKCDVKEAKTLGDAADKISEHYEPEDFK